MPHFQYESDIAVRTAHLPHPQGLDIKVQVGDTIRAAFDGIVTRSATNAAVTATTSPSPTRTTASRNYLRAPFQAPRRGRR